MKSKILVALSSSELEYLPMAHETFELIWLRILMHESRFICKRRMLLHCDNNSTLHIATNLVYHEWMKHIEVDYYFIYGEVASEEIALKPTYAINQHTCFRTKAVTRNQLNKVFSKLGIVNFY